MIDIESALDSHRQHHYTVQVKWTGNRGEGTSGYRTYSRNHESPRPESPLCQARPIPRFVVILTLQPRGAVGRLALDVPHAVYSISVRKPRSSCSSTGRGVGGHGGNVRWRRAIHGRLYSGLRWSSPPIAISTALSNSIERAHHLCFIANSVNFPVRCEPHTRIAEPH